MTISISFFFTFSFVVVIWRGKRRHAPIMEVTFTLAPYGGLLYVLRSFVAPSNFFSVISLCEYFYHFTLFRLRRDFRVSANGNI